MKVRIVDFKKSGNKYIDLVLQPEQGCAKTFKNTAELVLFMDTYKELEPINFTLNPFKLITNRQKDSSNNQVDSLKLSIKVDKLSEKVDSIIKTQGVLNKSIKSLGNNKQLPIEDKLDVIDNNVNFILNYLGIMEDSLSSKIDEMTEVLYDRGLSLECAFDNLMKKVDPLYNNMMEQISKEAYKPYTYSYPKCNSDFNNWRYKSLPEVATHFALNTRGDSVLGTISDEARIAFEEINNPTSMLHIDFDPKIIVSAREFIEIYDKCRKVTESAFYNDMGNIKESVMSNNDIGYYAAAGTMANQLSMQGIRILEDSMKDATGKKLYVTGTWGAVVTAMLCLGKMMKREIDSTSDMIGVKSSRIKHRGYKLNYNTGVTGSVLSRNASDISNVASTGDAHNTSEDKELYLKLDDTFDKDAFLSAMLYNCRVFTIETLNALVSKSGYSIKRGNIKGTPIYDYINKTNAKGIAEDKRLFLVYLRYYQQPFFGFNVIKDRAGTKDYIAGNTQLSRKALFDCLQNAYFTAKVLLFTDEDPELIPHIKRWDWLSSYDWVGSSYYDENDIQVKEECYHIKKFLEYMKICLCIQNLSPLCADMLLQMFCKYGKISFRVDGNNDDRYSIY